MSQKIHITDVGKQIAISGLLPETVHEILLYLAHNASNLANFLDKKTREDRDSFDFCLLFASLASPEFTGLTAQRFLHYSFAHNLSNDMAEILSTCMSHPQWQPYRASANAAKLLLDWINGDSMPSLEKQYPGLRAGKIQGLAREASWLLTGLSEILAASTKQSVTKQEKPHPLKELDENSLNNIKKIIPAIRLLSWRLNAGFPAEILWMSELKTERGKNAVSRSEAISLYQAGLYSYTDLRKRNNWPDMIKALISPLISNSHIRAQEIQELAKNWHEVIRKRTIEKLTAQLPDKATLIEAFINSREIEFQNQFETFLNAAGVNFTLFDDGKKPGAFDYILHIENRPDLVLECKTKQNSGLVDLGDARTVLGAAAQHGFNDHFCITLCNPGINPDVLADFSDCSKLAIVEAHDMCIALVRLIANKLSPQGFHDWLSQPGLIKAENLYTHSAVTIPKADAA